MNPEEQSIESILNRMIGNRSPVSESEYRAFTLKDQIYPTIERWGFEKQFHQEYRMNPLQQSAYDAMTGHMKHKGAIVALVGERGLGKTTIAAAFAQQVAWNNYHAGRSNSARKVFEHVIYRKCAKVVARYKPLFSDYGSVDTESLMESLDYLCNQQEYVVIDELHECDDLKTKSRVLTDLVDRRYACCRDTVLIANQTPAEFESTVSDSILSRLNQYGCIIECKWKSYRE